MAKSATGQKWRASSQDFKRMAGPGKPSIFPTWRYASGGRRALLHTAADWYALVRIAPLDEWYDSPAKTPEETLPVDAYAGLWVGGEETPAKIPAETPSLEVVSPPEPEPEASPAPGTRAAKRKRGRPRR